MKCLRKLGYLDGDNIPYQSHIDAKLFKVVTTRSGSFMNLKACFTQKGLQLLKDEILQAISDAEQLGYTFVEGGKNGK